MPADEYRREQLVRCVEDWGRAVESQKEEVERTESSNRWKRQLAESLGVSIE